MKVCALSQLSCPLIAVLFAQTILIAAIWDREPMPSSAVHAFAFPSVLEKRNWRMIRENASLTRGVAMKADLLPKKVQVCGFKDCRRAGGGARLEKLVNSVRAVLSQSFLRLFSSPYCDELKRLG